MMGRGLLIVLLATYALANPIPGEDGAVSANPPTVAVAKDASPAVEIEDIVDLNTELPIEEGIVAVKAEEEIQNNQVVADSEVAPVVEEGIVAVKAEEEIRNDQVVADSEVAPVVEAVAPAEVQSDEPVERVPVDEAVEEEATTVQPITKEAQEEIVSDVEVVQPEEEVVQPEVVTIVEKSVDASIQQDSAIGEEDSIVELTNDETIVEKAAVTDDATEVPVSERLADGEDIVETEAVEQVEDVTTVAPEAEESVVSEIREEIMADEDTEQVVTEASDLIRDESEVVTETEEPSAALFRSEDIESITTEAAEEIIADTTETIIPESPVDRVDTATDTYSEDSTTEIADEELTTDIKPAQSNIREIQADPSEPFEVEETEEALVTEVPIVKSEVEQQEVTTESVIEGTEVKNVDEIFENAAPIAVVEIQQDETDADDIQLLEDSVPIEIVEIVEPVVKSDEPEVTEEAADESVIEEVTDADAIPKVDDKDAEEIESQQSESKVQPGKVDDEYWLKMQQEAVEKAQTSSQLEDIEQSQDKAPEEVAEAVAVKDADVSEPAQESDSVSTDAPVVAAIATDVDAEMEKVAQKYGLTSVEKSKVEEAAPAAESSADVVVASEDVLKEDPIYQGSESRNEFPETNDLVRRLSFGDKVVRYVRSHW